MGFPTANIRLSQPVKHGIYVSRTQIQDIWYPSVTFVGIPKTFTQEALERAETHILEGNFELVGQVLTVELLKYLRPNQEFSSVSELIKAITNDVAQAKEYFCLNSLINQPR